MRLDNNNVNFTGKFYVVGKKNVFLKDPDKILANAVDKSVEAANAIINHCIENKIPCFYDDFTRETALLPKYRRHFTSRPIEVKDIPDEIVAHAFFTGDDAKRFEGVRSYTASGIAIPKENSLDAVDILKAIKEGLFDFVKDVIKK